MLLIDGDDDNEVVIDGAAVMYILVRRWDDADVA
jgi:hypothetical protein